MSLFIDPIPDTALKYTGPDISSLDIHSGDSLNQVISKLISKVQSVTSQDVSSNTLPSNASLYGLGGQSIAAAQIANRSFGINISESGQGKAQLIYDTSATKINLPTNYKVLTTSLNVTDYANKRTSASGGVGKVIISNLPATATLTMGVRTPHGDVQLEKQIYIPNSVTNTQTLSFEVKDLVSPGTSDTLSVKDSIEVLAAKVVVLSQQVEDLRSQNLTLKLEEINHTLSTLIQN